MKQVLTITQDLLKQIRETLEIDPTSQSGLRYKASCRHKNKAGTPAGSLSNYGYWRVTLNSKKYLNHRIVWALTHNQDPGAFIVDHIDGNIVNNHPSNLRLATQKENLRNRAKLEKRNSSGVTGVRWCDHRKKWQACICVNRKFVFLGRFDSLEKAAIVRRKAELMYFGSFAPIDQRGKANNIQLGCSNNCQD